MHQAVINQNGDKGWSTEKLISKGIGRNVFWNFYKKRSSSQTMSHEFWALQTWTFGGSNGFRGVHIFCKFWELRTEPEVQFSQIQELRTELQVQFWMVWVWTMVLNWNSPSLLRSIPMGTQLEMTHYIEQNPYDLTTFTIGGENPSSSSLSVTSEDILLPNLEVLEAHVGKFKKNIQGLIMCSYGCIRRSALRVGCQWQKWPISGIRFISWIRFIWLDK